MDHLAYLYVQNRECMVTSFLESYIKKFSVEFHHFRLDDHTSFHTDSVTLIMWL